MTTSWPGFSPIPSSRRRHWTGARPPKARRAGPVCGTAPPGIDQIEGEFMARILVVDDDLAIRQLLTDVLEMEGYEVSLAVDGLAAVREIRASAPDFVVLDVMMP